MLQVPFSSSGISSAWAVGARAHPTIQGELRKNNAANIHLELLGGFVADIDGLVRIPLTAGDAIFTREAGLLAATSGENENWAARAKSISSIKASDMLFFLAFFLGRWHDSCVSKVNILQKRNENGGPVKSI